MTNQRQLQPPTLQFPLFLFYKQNHKNVQKTLFYITKEKGRKSTVSNA